MRKILLAAVNARYSHTNPAVRSIERFVRQRVPSIEMLTLEWTIANGTTEILRAIIESGAELVLFSVYIWNKTLILNTIAELHKLFPNVLIGMGGPEASYQAKKILGEFSSVDFIMKGEGEQTGSDIAALFAAAKNREEFCAKLGTIAGIFYRQPHPNKIDPQNAPILFSSERALIADMNTLPFIYTDDGTASGTLSAGFSPHNQFAYYESSRGCPFQCTYCLSSLDTSVRYVPLERVLTELDFFLRHSFKTIKFTDRTFNLNPARYLAIWRHIAKNHNGKTAFHFEIDAQHLCDESFSVLETLPSGAVQFEIGLQSTNTQTLAEIRRTADLEKTAHNIARIPPNIHVHLDLIAGLPHENFLSFKKSFDFAAALKPHMLQLGFLKVLSGTRMEQTAAENDFAYLSQPPYEILRTNVLSYHELCRLKDIEHVLDIFYNSQNFVQTFRYISDGLFDFLRDFADFLSAKNQLYTPRTTHTNFAVLFAFTQTFNCTKAALFADLLRFDFISLGKTGSFPPWYVRAYNKIAHENALKNAENFFTQTENSREERIHPVSARERFARSDYDEFSINPLKLDCAAEQAHFLFLYPKRAEASTHNYSSKQNTEIRQVNSSKSTI